MKKKRVIPKAKRMKRLKKKLHQAWSSRVRSRDKVCILCEGVKGLSAHHWIVHSAGSLRTRWIPENGVTLCYACHIFKVHGRGDAENFDAIKTYMIPKHMGILWYDTIKRLAHEPWDPSEEELEARLKTLNKE